MRKLAHRIRKSFKTVRKVADKMHKTAKTMYLNRQVQSSASTKSRELKSAVQIILSALDL